MVPDPVICDVTPPLVKDLVEAVSTQSKTSNRLWMILMTLTILILIPQPTTESGIFSRKLPFGLGDIESTAFDLFAFLMLAILIIGFCQAQAQTIRASNFTQRILDSIQDGTLILGSICIRDLYDVMRTPSLNRVAPLAQLAQGNYHFNSKVSQCPKWRHRTTAIYYLFLKFIATAVYLILPGFAFWIAYSNIRDYHISGVDTSSWMSYLVNIIAAGAVFALLQVLIADVKYIKRVVILMWIGTADENKDQLIG